MAAPNPPVINPIDKYFEKVTRYHVFFFAIFFLSKFPSIWHTLNIIFLSPPMNYTCDELVKYPGSLRNVSLKLSDVEIDKCPCDNPVWDYTMFTKTVQTKFNIICDDKWLISFSESMSFFGLLVGALVFGVLSDRYGRLIAFTTCEIMVGVSGCLVAGMPTMALFIVMRFFEGIGCGGAIVTGFVLCMENCGPKYRATISSLLHIPSNLGLVALAGISYMIRDCDKFQLAISVPVLAFVATPCLILESPKWLLDRDREKTIKVMEKFCRFNNKPTDTIRADIESYHAARIDTAKLKFYHIFKYKNHTKNFFCMAYCYFVCGMCYYGVSQFIGKMSPEVHKSTAYNGLLVATGTSCCIFIINRVGRRPYLRSTMCLAGIFMFMVVSWPSRFKNSVLRVICACCSSSFFYMSFIIIFLYGVELFPTSIRNSVLGMLSLSSRIGQIMGPQINALSSTLAGFVFGISAIIAACLTFLLPETRGIELPSTLEESQSVSPTGVQIKSALSTNEPKADLDQPSVTAAKT